MKLVAKFEVELLEVTRGPAGKLKLGDAPATIDQMPAVWTVTDEEVHFDFLSPMNPNFAVNLHKLAVAAADAIEAERKRRRNRGKAT
jgi:hypothetical protein